MISDERLRELACKGVKILGSKMLDIDDSVVIESGVTIEDDVTILGNSIIRRGSYIGKYSRISDSEIGGGTYVRNSEIEHAYIGDMCTCGPYAHVHTSSMIGSHVRIGNFVEIKNSNIGDGTKIAHLAYVGDADIGDNCNIGCGAIFVNYDGITKRRSKVGNGVFVGSNCNVIAPVVMKDHSYLAAGSTLTVDLSEKDLCIARARECIKPMRSKYLK